MRAKFIIQDLNESGFVSKFRPGMKVETNNKIYFIKKVESLNNKFDILHVYDKKENKYKLLSSNWLEQNGTIIPHERQARIKEQSMTSREYEREIKGVVDNIKQSLDDDEIEEKGYDYIVDSAANMIYDESLYNYLYKKFKKYYQEIPNKRDLVEMLSNDMSNYFYK